MRTRYNGILAPVRTSFGLRGVAVKPTMFQCKFDVNTLNAVKSVLADLLSVSLLSFCSDEGLTLEMSANTLFMVFSISTSTLR